jgi:hypothetical protein
MSQIKVTPHCNIHYLADCTDCDWEVGLITDGTAQDIRNAVRRHVRTTGHRVIIESGSSTWYELESGLTKRVAAALGDP